MAKGGGSANKSVFSQENRTLLDEAAFEAFLRRRVASLGVAACPPYHLAVVVGGTSAERNLETLKLATAGALDHLPDISTAADRDVRGRDVRAGEGRNDPAAVFRDRAWEARLLAIARETGLGAQFGGAFLALDARVIRLPRHAASLPVSVGVSCSAHRNAFARIDADGAWLEDLDREPARFLPRAVEVLERVTGAAKRVDLGVPLSDVRRQLSGLKPGTLVLLTGPMLVARDAAHARFARMLRENRYAARVPPRPRRVLRRPRPHTPRPRDRQLRPHHCAAHGPVRRRVHEGRRLAGHACQGQPLPRGLRGLPGARRLLPRHHRRRRGAHRGGTRDGRRR